MGLLRVTLNFCCLHIPKAGITDKSQHARLSSTFAQAIWAFRNITALTGIHLTNFHPYLTQFKPHLLSKASLICFFPQLWSSTCVAHIASTNQEAGLADATTLRWNYDFSEGGD